MANRRERTSGDEVIVEMVDTCVLMRARLIARVVTGIHDEVLRPFGIGSAQFVLLAVIFQLQPATRAAIGRFHRQERSTLTRNLKVILAAGWAQEVEDPAGGRGRPLVLTKAGKDLLKSAAPAWREAQVESRKVLGKDGVTAVTAIANSLIDA